MKNIGEAFTFVFRDPDWLAKMLIGGIFVLLSVIAIGVPVLYGYCVELQQRVRRGEQYPLPEWKDVGVKFVVGFKYIVTILIYYLPLFLVMIPLIGFMIVASVSNSDFAENFSGAAFSIIILFFVMPVSLCITLLVPVISIKFAEHERIREGLEIPSVFRIFKDHWQDVLVAILISMGVGILSLLGLLLVIVGVVFTVFYSLLVRYHLFGQIAKEVFGAAPAAA